MTRMLASDGGDPEARFIDEIAGVLRGGGIAILPTDTIYGLHAAATDRDAIEKVARLKQRQAGQPFVVLCARVDQARGLGLAADDPTLEALGRLWPAPLTAILPLMTPIAASAGRDTIAVRIPNAKWLRELLERTGPLASTSVNLSGEREVYSTDQIPEAIASHVDLILDFGILEGTPSTLVDFTAAVPKVLREGEFFFTQKLWKTVWKSL